MPGVWFARLELRNSELCRERVSVPEERIELKIQQSEKEKKSLVGEILRAALLHERFS